MTTNKLQTKIRAVEENHADETLQNHLKQFTQSERDNALLALGAIGAVNKLIHTLTADSMRALIRCKTNKIHEAFGYNRFDDFLNESPYSPMTKNQFYQRKTLLENEGDQVFDLLNTVGVPASHRKLLGKGHVQIDNETNTAIVVTLNDKGEEITNEIELTDKVRLIETLSALADANAEKSKKLLLGEKDNKNLKRQIDELKNGPVAETGVACPAERDEIETTYLLTGSALKSLTDLLEDAQVPRVWQFAEQNLRFIAAQYQRLNEVIAQKLPSDREDRTLDATEDDRLASLLVDED